MNVELWEPELGGMLPSGEGFGHPGGGMWPESLVRDDE